MQKCLGEILNEENESQPINVIMANKDINSDTTQLTKILDPVSNDLSKYICNHCSLLFKINIERLIIFIDL